jgi:hypothetical protein
MENNMRTTITAIITALGIIFLVLSLTGCFSPYEGGVGSMRIILMDSSAQMGTRSSARTGGDSDYAGSYTITLTNAFGETMTQLIPDSDIEVSATFRLAPGLWTIEVRRGGIHEGKFCMTRYGRYKDYPVRTNIINEVEIPMEPATEVGDWETFIAIFKKNDQGWSEHPSSLDIGGILFITNNLIADSTLTFDFDVYNPGNNPDPRYTIVPIGDRTITSKNGDPVFKLLPNKFEGNAPVILGMDEEMIGLEGLIGTLTITGSSTPAFIEVNGGTLIMNDGVMLKDNAGGGGVRIHSGSNKVWEWIINGDSVITEEHTVTRNGTFEMYGGTISGNTGFDVSALAQYDFNQFGGSINKPLVIHNP